MELCLTALFIYCVSCCTLTCLSCLQWCALLVLCMLRCEIMHIVIYMLLCYNGVLLCVDVMLCGRVLCCAIVGNL